MSKSRKSGHANWAMIPEAVEATIMDLHDKGKTPLQISIATKVYSVDAVRRVLKAKGVSFALTGTTMTPETIEKAKALWFDGVTAKEIGLTFGVSQERIYSLRAVEGWPHRPNVRQAHAPRYTPMESDPSAGTVTLLALGLNNCRWPCGDPQSDDFSFCGRRRDGKSSYCVEHGRLAFIRCEAAE